jgi:hypothetical protein
MWWWWERVCGGGGGVVCGVGGWVGWGGWGGDKKLRQEGGTEGLQEWMEAQRRSLPAGQLRTGRSCGASKAGRAAALRCWLPPARAASNCEAGSTHLVVLKGASTSRGGAGAARGDKLSGSGPGGGAPATTVITGRPAPLQPRALLGRGVAMSSRAAAISPALAPSSGMVLRLPFTPGSGRQPRLARSFCARLARGDGGTEGSTAAPLPLRRMARLPRLPRLAALLRLVPPSPLSPPSPSSPAAAACCAAFLAFLFWDHCRASRKPLQKTPQPRTKPTPELSTTCTTPSAVWPPLLSSAHLAHPADSSSSHSTAGEQGPGMQGTVNTRTASPGYCARGAHTPAALQVLLPCEPQLAWRDAVGSAVRPPFLTRQGDQLQPVVHAQSKGPAAQREHDVRQQYDLRHGRLQAATGLGWEEDLGGVGVVVVVVGGGGGWCVRVCVWWWWWVVGGG